MVATNIKISDLRSINVNQSLKTYKYKVFYQKKTSTSNAYNISFKCIATILIKSYEIKILISLSSPLFNKHKLLVNFNLLFHSLLIQMISIFPIRPFVLLKKKKIKRNISFSWGQIYFQKTLSLPQQAATLEAYSGTVSCPSHTKSP